MVFSVSFTMPSLYDDDYSLNELDFVSDDPLGSYEDTKKEANCEVIVFTPDKKQNFALRSNKEKHVYSCIEEWQYHHSHDFFRQSTPDFEDDSELSPVSVGRDSLLFSVGQDSPVYREETIGEWMHATFFGDNPSMDYEHHCCDSPSSPVFTQRNFEDVLFEIEQKLPFARSSTDSLFRGSTDSLASLTDSVDAMAFDDEEIQFSPQHAKRFESRLSVEGNRLSLAGLTTALPARALSVILEESPRCDTPLSRNAASRKGDTPLSRKGDTPLSSKVARRLLTRQSSELADPEIPSRACSSV